jgi:hypothetical protein
MSVEEARSWLLKATMILTTALFLFLVVAPGFGFPLEYQHGEVMRIVQILFPVFLGYLGAGTHFVFKYLHRQEPRESATTRPLFAVLVKWPIRLWVVMCGAVLGMFWYTNTAGAMHGTAWDLDLLAMWLTAAMCFLNATTNTVVSYLFAMETGAR